MAGKKISQLDTANTLSGTEELPIVQDARTRKTTIDDIDTYINTSLQLFSATKTIATADVLTLNSTPVEVIAAPGAGLAIEVVSATLELQFNSIAYTTNAVVQLQTATATIAQHISATNLLFGTVAHTGIFTSNVGGWAAASTMIIANQALNANVAGGDPAAGDSDIVIRVLYRLISI